MRVEGMGAADLVVEVLLLLLQPLLECLLGCLGLLQACLRLSQATFQCSHPLLLLSPAALQRFLQPGIVCLKLSAFCCLDDMSATAQFLRHRLLLDAY